MNDGQKINEKKEQIQYKLHIMKALGWYISTQHIKQYQLANEIYMDPTAMSRALILPKKEDVINEKNYEQEGKRLIDMSIALEICKHMGTTLDNILYYYQFKNLLNNPSKIAALEKLTNGLKMYSEKDSMTSNALETKVKSVTKEMNISLSETAKASNLISDVGHPDFKPWYGKYFCYFSSTSSEEAGKKRTQKFDRSSDDPEMNELLSCATDEYIFCGILDIQATNKSRDDLCHVVFKFLANPEKQLIKKYTGVLTLSANTKAVFCELASIEQGEKTYFIFEKQDLGKEQPQVQCCMAMVLTYSSKVHRRRPCCERMIISRKMIKEGTEEYEAMKAYLRMNDNTIRITQWGYEELIKDIERSNEPELMKIAQAFPNLESLKSHNINLETCAFIPESAIYTSHLLNDTQKRKFEILLRLHSIAPWYCKTKATTADILFKLLNTPHE